MATSLPTDVDLTYADDAAKPGIKAHQQHHDAIHGYTNSHDGAVDPHGDRAFADGKFLAKADNLLALTDKAAARTNLAVQSTTEANAAYVVRSEAQLAVITAAEGTTSLSFVDLTSTGPTATATVGASGRVLVLLTAQASNNTVNCDFYMGVVLSGANTVGATPAKALAGRSATAGAFIQMSRSVFLTGLAAGSTTFTAKYRQDGGGTATFAHREMLVIPL